VNAGSNESFFDSTNELDDADLLGETAQIEDRITDKLAGAMEGHVAAAIDFEDRDTFAGQELARRHDVACVRVSSKRNHRRMLEKQKNVPNAVLLPEFHQVLLEAQGGAVVNAAEMDDGDQTDSPQRHRGTEK
jgi:hypothetical protein